MEVIIGEEEEKFPTYQTFSNYLSNIAEYFRKQLKTNIEEDVTIIELKETAKKKLPLPQHNLDDPGKVYNPRVVITQALRECKADPNYEKLRLLALVALRTVPLIRTGCAGTIRRDSIKETVDMKGRKILIFFSKGKCANIAKIKEESNYLEFLPEELKDYCPARIVLQLKNVIDQRKPSHNSLWTYLKDLNRPLKTKSLRPLLRSLLARAGHPEFTAHSLRTMSSEFLELVQDVPSEEIEMRSWKSKSKRPNTRLLNYRSRITKRNFSELMWGPLLPSQEVSQETILETVMVRRATISPL